MRKGQLSMEALGAVSIILLLYTGAVGLTLNLRQETSDRENYIQNEVQCTDLAAIIDAVYSNGPGTKTEYKVQKEATVGSGLVVLADVDGEIHTCTFNKGALDEAQTLSKKTYTIKNRGGVVEFI